MPPQRRKIVPPTTTSKGRRPKVAGSATRSPDATDPALQADAPAAETAAFEKAAALDKTAPPHKTAASEKIAALDKSEATEESEGSAKIIAPATSVELRKPPVSAAPVSAEPAPALDAPAAVSAWPSWRLVSGVGAAAAVLAAFAVVAAVQPGSAVDNRAWVDQSATSEVTAAATNAIETLYTYKADTIDQDFDAARGVLNPQMLEEFDKTADTTKSAVVQTRTGTDASLTDIGVTRLEDDKAELLVNMNVSANTDGVAQGSAEGPLTVNMEKIDGAWKLSAIDDQ